MSLLPRFAKSHAFSASSANPVPVVELYLDYACRFSAKLYKNWYTNLITKSEGEYQFVFRNYVQPWHPTSSFIHEASLAYAQLNPTKFWEFSYVLFDNIEDFYDETTADLSRHEVYAKVYKVVIEPHTNLHVDKQQFLSKLTIDTKATPKNGGNAVTNDIKFFTKIGRQNGVHVTPTVLVNGIKEPKIESSTPIEEVVKILNN